MTSAGMAQVRERWRIGVHARALVILTAVLIAFGLAVLYSASAYVAVTDGRPGTYYLVRQLSGLLVGIVVFMIAAKVDAERWRSWAWPIMGVTLLLMLIIVLPFTTSFAPRIHGSRRFLFGASLQPSELGKFAVVIWTAMLAVKKGEQLRRLTKGLLPFVVVIGTLALLAWLEPDLSVVVMYGFLTSVVLFAAGARVGHFLFLGTTAILVLWNSVEKLQYAVLRMTTFFDPGTAPGQDEWQLFQSLVAVGSGGVFGRGFGEGRQQLGFVPFGYNDFIASTVGEEFGFVGITLLVLLFAAFAALGFAIARQARTPFLKLVAVGLTATTVVTAYLHIAVAIGLLPTTGLTLPFVSFGRSNLVLSLFLTGVLVNIGSARERVYGVGATDPTVRRPA